MLFLSTQIKFNSFNKINIHSNKFLRYARFAKLSNLPCNLKSFTFFKDKDKKFLSNTKLLLFLNQGLSTNELDKLRFNLKNLGITFTNLPTRF
jgi:hypothetical protein